MGIASFGLMLACIAVRLRENRTAVTVAP